MKLLLDENLSPRLVRALAMPYPNSTHVDLVGLHGSADSVIWEFAATNGFTITSKDNDFRQLSSLRGHPPEVIWLSVGNASTSMIQALLADRLADVETFGAAREASLLVIRPRK